MKLKLILITLAILLASYVNAQDWSELQKTLPEKYLNNIRDSYGNSVSIDSNYAVIGTPKYNSYKGCAYLLFYNGTNWEIIATLTSSDGNSNTIDFFGESVCISGDQIIVGAVYNIDNGIRSGSAYIFEKPETGWETMTETAKLTPSDGNRWDNFGNSVSISGDKVVVGSYGSAGIDFETGAAYIFEKPETGWTDMTETAKLTASDGESSDNFGYSVGIFQDNVVVGAPQKYKIDSGKVYIFEKPESGWTTMTETAKLTASDGDKWDAFGNSVSISDSIVVIGATGDDDNGNYSGSAYIFEKPASGWVTMTETAKLTSSEINSFNDNFGSSVNISKDKIVISALSDNSDAGSVYVFNKPETGWTNMTETAKLTASDGEANDYFGKSVSIFDDIIVIGAYGNDDNGSETGSVYFYKQSTENEETYSFTQKTIPVKYMNFDSENYGCSVSIDGNFAVIGAPNYNTYQGRAHVLQLNGTYWENIAILTASDAEEGDRFASSVSISGNEIVVSARGDNSETGSAYVFKKPLTGWTDMTETAKLTASDGEIYEEFGSSVCISDNHILIGVLQDSDNGFRSGSAYLFEKPETGWETMTETAKLTASDGAERDYFGGSVSISGDNIVIGACLDDDNGISSGSVYLFKKPESGWVSMTETSKIISPNSESSFFGKSVCITGNTIVIGAPGNMRDSGSVYIFEKDIDFWTETACLQPTKRYSNDRFGISVAISGDNVIVGSDPSEVYYERNLSCPNESVYFFEKPQDGWSDLTETAKLDTTFVTETEIKPIGIGFGSSISISGNNIVIGAYLNGIPGSAFFYSHKNSTSFEEVKQNTIAVYPNPTSSIININGPEKSIQQITIYDINGKEIITKTNNQQGSTQINLTGFKQGIYLLQIRTNDETITKKVVRE